MTGAPAPGARLLDLVTVMDRLRSPGGCPWDAEQTHGSLLRYLVEECYEFVEVVEAGDREGLREELGDLLLQVVFHARLAAEDPTEPFDIDDVADGIIAKLTYRHPHVFGGLHAADAAEVERNWEALKAAEKGRTSAMDGIPLAQPALALAAKVQARAHRGGAGPQPVAADLPDDVDIGEALFALVALARERGVDPEEALRATSRRFVAAVREAEAAARSEAEISRPTP
jgi:XTP/dITP diphosphohydrolase